MQPLALIFSTLHLLPISAEETPVDFDPVPRLMQNLNSPNDRFSVSAARSLGIIFSPGKGREADADKVIEVLSEQLASAKNWMLRRECAVALGNMKMPAAVEALKAAMNDEDVNVAIEAANGVASILPHDKTRELLIKQSQEGPSETIRIAAYNAVVPYVAAEDAPFLTKGLESDNWRIQTSSLRGLERAVRNGARLKPEDYDKIGELLGHETSNVADAAMHYLSDLRNGETTRVLLTQAEARGDESKTDSTWRNRTYALRGLNRMWEPTIRQALPVVIRQLGDSVANVSNESRQILNRFRNDEHYLKDFLFPYLLTELEGATDARVKTAILSEMGSNFAIEYSSRIAKVGAAALEQGMEDKSAWALRTHALTLLGKSGYTGSVETIAQCVSDDIPNVRQAAGYALEQLDELCTPEQRAKVAPILLPLLEKPHDWRKTGIAARVSAGFPSVKAVDPLVKLLSHSIVNVQDGASRSLSVWVTLKDAEELKDAVKESLIKEVSRDQQAWEYGTIVLGSLADASSIELLTRILKDGNWRAKANAANAVSAIATKTSVKDKALSEALIGCAQSDVHQVRDAANTALRLVSKGK
ncbi:MAG: HEAT repeat domain-containing protein [Planctomycetota bacterium]|nr:HEAT repeat domain-containing protein [Planctomycetota bacterium]MDA1139090.1 HEAT repeat domain-containing protein [Planctomycetota bacterium]